MILRESAEGLALAPPKTSTSSVDIGFSVRWPCPAPPYKQHNSLTSAIRKIIEM